MTSSLGKPKPSSKQFDEPHDDDEASGVDVDGFDSPPRTPLSKKEWVFAAAVGQAQAQELELPSSEPAVPVPAISGDQLGDQPGDQPGDQLGDQLDQSPKPRARVKAPDDNDGNRAYRGRGRGRGRGRYVRKRSTATAVEVDSATEDGDKKPKIENEFMEIEREPQPNNEIKVESVPIVDQLPPPPPLVLDTVKLDQPLLAPDSLLPAADQTPGSPSSEPMSPIGSKSPVNLESSPDGGSGVKPRIKTPGSRIRNRLLDREEIELLRKTGVNDRENKAHKMLQMRAEAALAAGYERETRRRSAEIGAVRSASSSPPPSLSGNKPIGSDRDPIKQLDLFEVPYFVIKVFEVMLHHTHTPLEEEYILTELSTSITSGNLDLIRSHDLTLGFKIDGIELSQMRAALSSCLTSWKWSSDVFRKIGRDIWELSETANGTAFRLVQDYNKLIEPKSSRMRIKKQTDDEMMMMTTEPAVGNESQLNG